MNQEKASAPRRGLAGERGALNTVGRRSRPEDRQHDGPIGTVPRNVYGPGAVLGCVRENLARDEDHPLDVLRPDEALLDDV